MSSEKFLVKNPGKGVALQLVQYQRIRVGIKCPMDFRNYPFDEHR
jgi:hypothetical protein